LTARLWNIFGYLCLVKATDSKTIASLARSSSTYTVTWSDFHHKGATSINIKIIILIFEG